MAVIIAQNFTGVEKQGVLKLPGDTGKRIEIGIKTDRSQQTMKYHPAFSCAECTEISKNENMGAVLVSEAV